MQIATIGLDIAKHVFQVHGTNAAGAVATTHFAVQMSVMEAVKTFSAFTQDNDPRGEHDFGEFEVGGERYCWKIDCCDPVLEFELEGPADPNSKSRLLTLMFADEYWQLKSEQVGF